MFRPKYHQKNKAALAEHAVYEVKLKLYKMMRYYKTKDWVKLLPDAVNLLNSRPMTRNGGIPPSEINSSLQDPLLRQARLDHNVKFPEPNRSDEIQNEEDFNKTQQPIIVGSYVFLDRKPKTFDKSFELQVRRTEFGPVY